MKNNVVEIISDAKLTNEQQIRNRAYKEKTPAFRMWKSRMKSINLNPNPTEYVLNGYAKIQEYRNGSN